jgi:crossover junction endodeoxyribonuclease RuvC
MIVVGIDPGLTGAVGILYSNGPVVWDMHTIRVGKRHHVDAHGLAEELRCIADAADARVFVEAQSTRPGLAAQSVLRTGEGYGIVLGVLAALGLSCQLVLPQSWRPAMCGPRRNDGHDKDTSRQVAMRLFPALAGELHRVKDHGRAEALLIAEYGRRMMGGR